MPDRASYEVQGKTRFLTMLARGGSRVCYTLDREPRWVLKVGPQEAHHFEWELFALSLDSWPQVCRRFTLQVEVPGIPAQDLRAYTVERMVAPIRPTPDGSFLQMCIMLCFWSGLRLPEGYLHPRDQGEHNWGYLGMPKYHRLTSLDVANWGTREHYGFPSQTRLVSFFRWFDQDSPTLSNKVRRWVSLHHASIPMLASLLLWELKNMDMVFVEALIDMKVLYELPSPDYGLARPLGNIMEEPRWELVPLREPPADAA